MAPTRGASWAISAGTRAAGLGAAGLESRKEMEAEASLYVDSCEILGKLLNLSEPVSSSTPTLKGLKKDNSGLAVKNLPSKGCGFHPWLWN